MNKEIKKALIPAAGFGTRFLPQTKAMPKEMMPLVDKPIIQRVVEELVESGIETIVIVTNSDKRPIEDHFDNNFELESKLQQSGKEKELSEVRKISDMAEFLYVRQKGPMGNATPILNAKHIMGDEPFMLFWGDDFIDAQPSRAIQLINAYKKYNSSILGSLRATCPDDYTKYGFAGGREIDNGVIRVDKVVEKPLKKENSPSDLAVISGFVFTPDIYPFLEKAKSNLQNGDELVYLYGVQGMIDNNIPVHALEIQNAIYRDTGNKLKYLETVMEYGLLHKEFGGDFRRYLIERAKELEK